MICDVWTYFWLRIKLDRGHHWVLEGFRRTRNWLLRRRRSGVEWDPWAEQRRQPGLWVAIADSLVR